MGFKEVFYYVTHGIFADRRKKTVPVCTERRARMNYKRSEATLIDSIDRLNQKILDKTRRKGDYTP